MSVRADLDCEDELERNLVRSVSERGFAVQSEPAHESVAAHTYTVGLHHRFGHPELVVLGLSRDRAEALLCAAAERVRAGSAVGDVTDELLHDYPCRVSAVAPDHHRAYLGYARWFYRGDGFSALQLVWPDREGHFPDQADFTPRLRDQQPLLG